MPIEPMQDTDRLYPGEGIIPINRILAEFERMGYDGEPSMIYPNDEGESTLPAPRRLVLREGRWRPV